MTIEDENKLAIEISRLAEADAFEEEQHGRSYWTAALRAHIELWIGDQPIVYVGHEWHYRSGDSVRTSRKGLLLADSLRLVVVTNVYVMLVTVEATAGDYDEPAITASRLIRRSSLSGLVVEPRTESPDARHGLRFKLSYPGLTAPVDIPSLRDSESMTDADPSLLAALREDYFADGDDDCLVIIS